MVINKIKDFIKHHRLINKDDRIVVGVSGGPDSVALLYILNSLRKEFHLSLHVAHLNHMLRPDSSREEKFVEDLALSLGLPYSCTSINVKELSRFGSVEDIGRKVRLAYLFKVARDLKTKKIALGHNFDDQAETILMRILRGAGLYGLIGILPKREIFGFTIIRPLLCLMRREIISYLKRRKLKFCQDYTNLEDMYLRNRIRHHLLPLLEREYNKNIRKVLVNMSESIGYDYEYLLRLTRKIFLKKEIIYKRRIKFNLKEFLKLEPAIQRMLIRLSIKQIKGDLRKFDFRHIREIEDLLYQRPLNSIVDLPYHISVVKTKDNLSIYQRN
ncbi:MAG: tRNA lysidine(34) synthetase TilS [Candidatus Omnitrophica bacterium]|nr:tRNA lysidine(34) synthetase TilS [Candidatus Omnitrophota bacterium]